MRGGIVAAEAGNKGWGATEGKVKVHKSIIHEECVVGYTYMYMYVWCSYQVLGWVAVDETMGLQ